MHGEALALIARLHLGRGLDDLTQAAHRLRQVVGANACKRVLTRLSAGGLPKGS